MTASHSLHDVYASLMKNHDRFGLALYEPPLSSLIQPGSVGYFDGSGSWNPVVQLADQEELEKLGFEPTRETLDKAETDRSIVWGPKCSIGVKGTAMDLKAAASLLPAGIPASAAVVYKYKSDKSSGAILMTSQPVFRDRYFFESPFRDWVKQNALKILARRPEVCKHGLWVVTSTYSAADCSINVWNRKGKEVVIGFSVRDVVGSEAGPAGQWFEATSDSDWSRYYAYAVQEKTAAEVAAEAKPRQLAQTASPEGQDPDPADGPAPEQEKSEAGDDGLADEADPEPETDETGDEETSVDAMEDAQTEDAGRDEGNDAASAGESHAEPPEEEDQKESTEPAAQLAEHELYGKMKEALEMQDQQQPAPETDSRADKTGNNASDMKEPGRNKARTEQADLRRVRLKGPPFYLADDERQPLREAASAPFNDPHVRRFPWFRGAQNESLKPFVVPDEDPVWEISVERLGPADDLVSGYDDEAEDDMF